MRNIFFLQARRGRFFILLMGLIMLLGTSPEAFSESTKPVPGLINYCGFEGFFGGEGGWGSDSVGKDEKSPITFDSTNKFYGKSSVKIPGGTGVEHYAYTILIDGGIPVQPDKNYVFRGYVKTDNVTGTAYVRILAHNTRQKKGVLGWVTFEGNASFKGTAEWKPFEVVPQFPEGTDVITLYVGIDGPGTVWFDEVSFAERGVIVPLGGRLPLTVKDYGGVRLDDQNLPVNLILNSGFEDDIGDTWTREGPSEIDTTVAHSGKKSLKFIGRDQIESSVRQGVRIDSMRAYELGVWVKTENLENMFYAKLLCFDKSGNVVNKYWFVQDGSEEFLHTSGTHDWQKESLIIKAFPPETDKVVIYLNLTDAAGTVWIDDVELQPLTLKESPEARPEASKTGGVK